MFKHEIGINLSNGLENLIWFTEPAQQHSIRPDYTGNFFLNSYSQFLFIIGAGTDEHGIPPQLQALVASLFFMKLLFLTTFLTSILLFFGCSNGQTKNTPVAETPPNKTMDNFDYTLKSSHPKAQALMTDKFFWSPIEETAPFGSDDGFDAAYGFRQWRFVNKTASPISYLKDLIERWQYPYFDYNEMDITKITEYITRKANLDETKIQQQIQTLKDINENSADTSSRKLDDNELRDVVISSSNRMGGSFLLGQDNAIIGIGFAQFVLEGRIDKDIKNLTITAIKRQLLPVLINRYDDNYRDIRKQQLTKMLEVINKAGS